MNNSTPKFDLTKLAEKFQWEEYVVFFIVLVVSSFIGIFYGCIHKSKKNDSNEEFLTGNRQMGPFPVAISLVCSAMSAVSVLGISVETYQYGVQYFLSLFDYMPISLCLYYIYGPVYQDLNLTSGFEYFELRFNRTVRLIVSIITIITQVLYSSFVVFGPAVSIAQATGIHHRLSVIAIFLVCIFYSSLGGMRAVLQTDVFQGLVMFFSLGAIVIRG